MTETSPGPGWWLASDGNWYPPHLHPDARARAAAEASAAASADHAREDTEHLGRAVVADHVARAAEADTVVRAAVAPDASDPTRAFDPTRTFDSPQAGDDPGASAGPSGPGGSIDQIVAASAGGIDWEAVARERAAAREARNQRSVPPPRTLLLGAGVVVVIALLALWLVTRGGGDDTTRTVTTPSSTLAPSTTAAPATTAAPSTTAAPATSTSKASGATGTTSTTAAPKASTTTAATATTVTAAPGGAQNVSVFSLAPGSCIDQDNLTTGLVTTVRVVPCEQPHSHEVYLKTTVTPADATYDAAKVTSFANQACSDGFKAYVGIAYESSKYYFLHLAPSAESWNKNKDRDVVCLLLLEGQKLTGSVKGKGE